MPASAIGMHAEVRIVSIPRAAQDRDMRRDEPVNPGRSPGEPSTARLPLDHPRRRDILSAHDAALAAGSPGYRDPATGLFVMTARYLSDRGYCCGNGCRHCPYC